MVAQRQDLVAALVASTDLPFRARVRRFVSGLSADELQFIAEYLGSCILESAPCRYFRAEMAGRIAGRQPSPRPVADRDHKLILLREYLGLAGQQQLQRARAGYTARS